MVFCDPDGLAHLTVPDEGYYSRTEAAGRIQDAEAAEDQPWEKLK